MRIILLTIGLWSAMATVGQHSPINRILSQNARIPEYLPVKTAGIQTVIIPCAYGQPVLNFPSSLPGMETSGFKQVQVLSAELVYTDHPAVQDLKALNTQRLINLFTRYPELAADSNIVWRVNRQTNGATKESAISLLHGFVIHYRVRQSNATIAADLDKLKTLLKPKITTNPKQRRGFVAGDTMRLREQYEIEDYTLVQKLPVEEALRYLGIDEKEKYSYKNYDSLYVYEKPPGDSSAVTRTLLPPEDSTVLQVLDRMSWERMLVVADVTASMYPYSGQLMYWLRLHEDERRIHQFVFFNDGDQKEEVEKVTGKTGGIYTTGSSVYAVVEKTVYQAMSNGCGGAIPENNLEALLTGLRTCTTCKDVVMIADNWSGVSDMALLANIRQPVHIILCGVLQSIQPDYLTIAWQTGGSLHFARQDINDLARYKEGDTLRLYGQNYTITGGRFVKQ